MDRWVQSIVASVVISLLLWIGYQVNKAENDITEIKAIQGVLVPIYQQELARLRKRVERLEEERATR